jgi:hypothetical protein
MYYTTFSPKLSRAFPNFFIFKTNLGVFHKPLIVIYPVFSEALHLITASKTAGQFSRNAQKPAAGLDKSGNKCYTIS